MPIKIIFYEYLKFFITKSLLFYIIFIEFNNKN